MNMAHFVYPAIANSGQAATAYPTAQPAYVAAAPQAAYATPAPRAGQTYDSYQTAHAQQYAYTTRTPVAVTPTAAYDQSKAYYQPSPAASAYTAAETHYQAGNLAKPSYTTSTYNTTPRQTNNPKPPVQVSSTPAGTYVYPATTTPAATTYNNPTTYASTPTSSSYSGKAQRYDAALYSAATNFYQQQQAAKATGGWSGFKKQNTFGQNKQKPKGPPKPPQLHYCDVCKISCAGPQTYREHLDGQKHKKKEQALKLTQPASRNQNQLRCELCDVTCTGSDAYAAHIRGSKHQKVLKLHTKLGKPIPSTEPVVVSYNSQSTTSTAGKTNTATTSSGIQQASKVVPKIKQEMPVKKVFSTPKITFVGGTQLKTTGAKTEEVKTEVKTESASTSPVASDSAKSLEDKLDMLDDKDLQPVGFEYIDEVKNEVGKVISFHCKLCECKFNDPNAKEMHMKGRRHRLQFKKKVDPTLVVDLKPSIRVRKAQEEKLRRQTQKEEFWRRREQEDRWREEMRMEEEIYWEERRRYEEELDYIEWQRRQGRPGPLPPRLFPPMPPSGPSMMRKPDSSDDRHVMAKHASIYPNETELQAVQNIVSSCEKALKLVSDHLAESNAPKMEVDKEKDAAKKTEKEGEEDSNAPPRVLKGVMRVGVLAKGLLLHGDLNVNLVVLCAEKPTRTLLERVADGLPKQMGAGADVKYEVKMCVEEAAIIVSSQTEPKTSCTITLTSPVMRDTAESAAGESVSTKDPPDVLDRQKCLDALAALRHAKWFQARANGLQSCVVVIRILRDLCQRVPTWTPLNEWAMELLVEKCVSSGGNNMSPGDALRRVFECISSGILLPGNPGLYDPCEKEQSDASSSLTNQQREVITSSAQHALRLIAFRQIHKVLGMDLLPPPQFRRQRFNPRKRRRTNSAGETTEDGGEKKEKKEGEETEASMESAVAQS